MNFRYLAEELQSGQKSSRSHVKFKGNPFKKPSHRLYSQMNGSRDQSKENKFSQMRSQDSDFNEFMHNYQINESHKKDHNGSVNRHHHQP